MGGGGGSCGQTRGQEGEEIGRAGFRDRRHPGGGVLAGKGGAKGGTGRGPKGGPGGGGGSVGDVHAG